MQVALGVKGLHNATQGPHTARPREATSLGACCTPLGAAAGHGQQELTYFSGSLDVRCVVPSLVKKHETARARDVDGDQQEHRVGPTCSHPDSKHRGGRGSLKGECPGEQRTARAELLLQRGIFAPAH